MSVQVQAGQVWEDLDKRRVGRKFEVVDITGKWADCKTVEGGIRERTKIRLDRFNKKYYALKSQSQPASPPTTSPSANAGHLGPFFPTAFFTNKPKMQKLITVPNATAQYQHLAGDQSPQAQPQDATGPTPDSKAASLGKELADECNNIIPGTWGGFGTFAFLDCGGGKVEVVVRFVRKNCYDIKVRMSEHLVYSNVSDADLETSLGQARAFLKSMRDTISEVVG